MTEHKGSNKEYNVPVLILGPRFRVSYVRLIQRIVYTSARTTWISKLGKIQGDGRKFLNRFKSYFGSQISSQSLNEIHIYRLQPKSATKDDSFSHIFFVFDCQFESVHVTF